MREVEMWINFEKYRQLDLILDDESYFTLDRSAQPGNDKFYSSNFK